MVRSRILKNIGEVLQLINLVAPIAPIVAPTIAKNEWAITLVHGEIMLSCLALYNLHAIRHTSVQVGLKTVYNICVLHKLMT